MRLNKKISILGKRLSLQGKNIKKIELREYVNHTEEGSKQFFLMLYMETDEEELEIDYLGKPTKEEEKFKETADFLCNYNGLLSTINRLLIELESKGERNL